MGAAQAAGVKTVGIAMTAAVGFWLMPVNTAENVKATQSRCVWLLQAAAEMGSNPTPLSSAGNVSMSDFRK